MQLTTPGDREIVPPERLVVTERWDQPWYPGQALVTISLVEDHRGTTMTTTVQYESQAARDAVLSTDMAKGVAVRYDRLAALLRSSG